jgi:hypothetical protein
MALPAAGTLGVIVGLRLGVRDHPKRGARLSDALDARARPAYPALTMTVFAPPATSTS